MMAGLAAAGMNYVPVFETGDMFVIPMVQELLAAHDVPCTVNGEADLSHWPHMVPGATTYFFVPQGLERKARLLLTSLWEEGQAVPGQVH